MKATDIAIALFALAGMLVFNLTLAFYVKEPALSVVIVVGLVMMTYDFWRQYAARRRSA